MSETREYLETIITGHNLPTDSTGTTMLIWDSTANLVKSRTYGLAPKTENYNVQYYYNGELSGATDQMNYYEQKVLRVNRAFNAYPDNNTVMTTPTPVEGDIIRIKDNARYTDGYYVMNSAGSWVAIITW